MASTKKSGDKTTTDMIEKQIDELIINIIHSLDHFSDLVRQRSLGTAAQILQKTKQEIAYWSANTDYRNTSDASSGEGTADSKEKSTMF